MCYRKSQVALESEIIPIYVTTLFGWENFVWNNLFETLT